jgi:hypothetical protein
LFQGKVGINCYGVCLQKLKKAYEVVPKDITELDLQRYIKAYLLYLLGTVLFTNASNTVPVLYLPLLDLERIDNYAWGAATLATIKHSMNRKKKNGQIKSLCGFSYALLVRSLDSNGN